MATLAVTPSHGRCPKSLSTKLVKLFPPGLLVYTTEKPPRLWGWNACVQWSHLTLLFLTAIHLISSLCPSAVMGRRVLWKCLTIMTAVWTRPGATLAAVPIVISGVGKFMWTPMSRVCFFTFQHSMLVSSQSCVHCNGGVGNPVADKQPPFDWVVLLICKVCATYQTLGLEILWLRTFDVASPPTDHLPLSQCFPLILFFHFSFTPLSLRILEWHN